ncbi:MAG TPA: hypothetical protein DDY91_22135 [Planctomycetaceae bacterium]|nr:hypothetical protein [Planctomycetaceae bacterium]
MIECVEITNLKNIRQQTIELGRLCVFVGANASGKTTVLDAIQFAVRAVKKRADKDGTRTSQPGKVFGYERHCDWLYTRGGTGDLRIACTTSGGTFSVAATPPPGFLNSKSWEFGKGEWSFHVTPEDPGEFELAYRDAKSLVFLRLNVEMLAKPSYASTNPPRVEYDGRNLASVLAYMALNDPDAFAKVVDDLRSMVPRLKRIRFAKAPVRVPERELVRIGNESIEHRSTREFLGDSLLFDFTNATGLSASTVSEGTLLLLGLLTVLSGPSAPSVILLDDIDHGLHPVAQSALLDVLHRLMDERPEIQVLASAHSPYLIDGLEPDQVRLLATGPDGNSVCGRLSDHPDFERWKNEMAPGEMWSLFGEKWLPSATTGK